MRKIIECRECTADNRSKRTVLRSATGGFDRPYELWHVSAGYEPAGSMMRHVGECYRVASWDRDGTRHSKAYRDLQEATAEFERLTTPIEERTA